MTTLHRIPDLPDPRRKVTTLPETHTYSAVNAAFRVRGKNYLSFTPTPMLKQMRTLFCEPSVLRYVSY